MDSPWSLYQSQPGLVLGFHGTDVSIVNQVVGQKTRHLDQSEDVTEWLGHGIYFWENDPKRALDWASIGKTKGKVTVPDALGAVIDLGLCLDLTTLTGLAEVSKAFATLQMSCQLTGLQLPQNTGGRDKARRELDCKVIETLHGYRKDHGMPDYDSVRAFFPEDECLYPDAGFRKRNHVQICVIRPTLCIKGYFKPIKN